MAKTSLRVPAWKDGFPIAVTVYTPVGDLYDTEKMVVLISSAIGVPQAFYSKFATWLAGQNICVVTWDYRFMGDSLPAHVTLPVPAEKRLELIKSPEASEITIKDHWAMLDQPAVVEYVLDRFKGHKLVIVGHSTGAHMVALLPERLRSQIYRAVFVSANNPYPGFAPIGMQEWFRGKWIQTLNVIEKYGYLPASEGVFGIILPRRLSSEWALSIINGDERWRAADPELSPSYTSWEPQNEIIALAFQDDITLISRGNVAPIDGWCEVHTGAAKVRVYLTPEECGRTEVGHIGMFRGEPDVVWNIIRDTIVHGKIPNKGDIRRWKPGNSRL